jgi:Family of unknown function (DUF6152)
MPLMKLSTRILVAVGATLVSGIATSHHSFAMFDNAKDVVLEGTVKEFQWTNPHTWIQLMVTDASGKQVEWSIEGASPNGLVRQGWTRNSLKPGDKATVVIHPLKDGKNGGSVVRVTVNGQVLGRAGGQGPISAPAADTPAAPTPAPAQ